MREDNARGLALCDFFSLNISSLSIVDPCNTLGAVMERGKTNQVGASCLHTLYNLQDSLKPFLSMGLGCMRRMAAETMHGAFGTKTSVCALDFH